MTELVWPIGEIILITAFLRTASRSDALAQLGCRCQLGSWAVLLLPGAGDRLGGCRQAGDRRSSGQRTTSSPELVLTEVEPSGPEGGVLLIEVHRRQLVGLLDHVVPAW